MNTRLSMVKRLVLAATASAAGVGFCAVPNVAETWSTNTSAGWLQHDLVNERLQDTLEVQDGALSLSFKKQSMDLPPEEYVFEAGSGASGAAFTGDYIAQGVTDIRFRLFCERKARVSVLLWNADASRVWRYRIPNIQTGEWMQVSVPLSMPSLHCLGEAESWARFEADMRNIAAVGVAIEREHSLDAQVYRLDDFMVAGAGPAYAAWIGQFPRPPGYGMEGCDILPGSDLDGDGVANDNEWVAGTSAGDPHDYLELTVERGPRPARLRWKASPGRRYQVWSTPRLDRPFVPATPPMEVTGPEAVFDDDATNQVGSAFYRITVDYPQP